MSFYHVSLLRCVGAALVLVAMAAPTLGKSAREWRCTGDFDIPWQDQIVGCTNAISSGTHSDKGIAWAYANRGEARRMIGDLDAAVADQDQAIGLDPKYAGAYTNRGEARREKGDLDAAIADHDQAIRLNPKYVVAYIRRGNVKRDKGDVDAAIADYDQAIRIDPKSAMAYGNRGRVKRDKGDLDAAIVDFDQAIRIDPKMALVYSNRGAVKRDKGDFDGAIADFDQAIRIDPKLALAYSNRGNVKRDKGDFDAAIADYDQAIRIDPTSPFAYTGRGLVEEKKGDIVRARADYQAALAVPQEGAKWAHDTARQHLTSLAAQTAKSSVASPPIVDTKALNGRRVALVIGNSNYANVARLENPTNDARLMADTLRALGFHLIGGGPQLNLDKAALDRLVQQLGAESLGADVGLFYYAGHGVQVRGSNYLVPVDANPTREGDVDFQMLDANMVLRQMTDAGTKLNLVLLDACRNNPFGGRGLRAATGGLAQMRAPEGTLISFATQPGNVALDGVDGDSPYTKAVAEVIRKPKLDVFRTFNEVGLAVAKATGGQQQPWLAMSPISGDFYFAGGQVNGQE
jgi:tetratricopeptide (TPR) repeat protein